MIYVHRDLSKVPGEKLARLKALSEELEKIAIKADRKAFIAANADAWSDVRGELESMSFGKCWYTESRDPVSRNQTDHYRPHGRAKQAEGKLVEGYSWLAFDVTNYRIIGVLANTQNQEYSEETVGKGIWFPLADPEKRATLENPDISGETPLLLDPIDIADTVKIVFWENGEAHPAAHLDDEAKATVDDAIVRMGIRQEMLNTARRQKWRDCNRTIEKYTRFVRKQKGLRSVEEETTIDELAQELITMASCESEFSAAVRCCLISERLEMFIVRDELNPLKLA